MGISQKIRSKHKKGVVGALRHPIGIIYPRIMPADMVGHVDYWVSKEPDVIVFGDIDTMEAVATFGGANVGIQATHKVMIRYRKEITKEYKFRIYGDLYEIVDFQDFSNRKEFMQLKCRLIGREANVPGVEEELPEEYR